MIDSDTLQYKLMSELLVPDLAIADRLSHQNEDLYSEQRFVSLLFQLSERSILFTCPYDRATLRNFFAQICLREQARQLSLETVHQFISELKQRNRRELTIEAEYYEGIMGGHLKNGIHSISRREMVKAMDRYSGELQIITQIMQENSKDAEFVGCELVMDLIKQIREELEDAVIPELSITKLKTLRLESDRVKGGGGGEGEEEGRMVAIFDEIGQYEVKRLLGHYSTVIGRKIAYFREFITDVEVSQDVDEFIDELKSLEGALWEEVQQMIDVNDQFKAHQQEFNSVLANLEAEQVLQGQIIDGLKQRGEEYKQELAEMEGRNGELQRAVQQLQNVLRETQGELVTLSEHYQTVQEQLVLQRRRNQQIQAQYWKLVGQGKQKLEMACADEAKKLFSSRSLKEQLEDTAQRLNRLLNDRERQRKATQQNEEQNQNKIVMLEERLEELERELQQKNQFLCEYIKDSRLSRSKMSAVFRMSKISAPRSVHNVDFPQDQEEPLSDSVKGDPRQSKISVVSLQNPLLARESNKRASRASRISRISLAVLGPVLEEQSSLQDISEVYTEQNVVGVIKEDQLERSPEAFKKKGQNQSQQGSPIKQEKGKDSKGKYFFSKGMQMNIHGIKFQTFLLLTQKRFCYFDTKVRLEKFLPIANIKEFTFITQNPNLFIIKPLNPQTLGQKKHITNDMIFSTRNVSRLQAFLAKLRTNHNITVTVKRAENAWLKVNHNEYNLGMGVKHSCHPCRMALAHQPVFYAEFKGEGFISSRTNVILVVQPMGVVCFEGEEPYELEESHKQFFAWLPLCGSLRMTDKKASKEAPDRKLLVEYGKAWDKCWQIVFQTKEDMRRFKQSVEQQLEKNNKLREERREAVTKLLPPQ